MDDTVGLLKERLPYYTWAGIYLLEGDELVLGPYLGKPSPAHAYPAEQRHLRRRRLREDHASSWTT
jgi:putative methionine-R-sulfoxide reductase with GAF domain